MSEEYTQRKMIFANEELANDFIKRENLDFYFIGPWGEKGEFVVYYYDNESKSDNVSHIAHYISPFGENGEFALYSCDSENKNDNVNHPAHYTSGGIECIDGMVAAFGREYVMHYCLCNAFKYIWRCEHKGKRAEDIQKAVWYLNKWQSLAEKEAMIDECNS